MAIVNDELNVAFLFDPNLVSLIQGDGPSKDPLYTFPVDSILFRLRPLSSTDYNHGMYKMDNFFELIRYLFL